jgi:hypothetical protein
MIEEDVHKNVLQRAVWTLPRPIVYVHEYFYKIIKGIGGIALRVAGQYRHEYRNWRIVIAKIRYQETFSEKFVEK